MEQRRNSNALGGCLIVIVIVAIIVVLVVLSLGLRGCGNEAASTSASSSSAAPQDVSVPAVTYVDFAIENKTYRALHAQRLPNEQPLDVLVHVVEVAYDPGLVVIIRLNLPKAELQGAWGAPVNQSVLTRWTQGVMSAVPATRILVLDSDGVVIGAVTRQ
jgi:hypothetical protein